MNLEILTQKVISCAKIAGELIRENIDKSANIAVQTKGLNDFVTEIDQNCERIIVDKLSELLPEAGFIAEENTSIKIGKEYNWIIDPLDGTTNFIHGMYPCAVSIGLKFHNEIVLGVIYEVGLDECFYAWKGGGAWLNNNLIRVSEKTKLSQSLLATGFPYHEFNKLDNYINLLKYLTKNTVGIRRLGSAATDMAYVACGRFDGFYEYDLKPYDVAAGIVIVKEAGGKLCDFSGGDDYLFGKEIIATNSYIYDEMLNVVKKCMS